ncbi:hypothetical protein Taro_020108 [Colocasia esculenta]|uniref:Uncharacterized protein n=1 Tax=Colocasia esculenta TaxID=4460 RepID=A0A843V167_COLES|nr:hypothetical protein [Colocasia esculenta]
MAAPGDESVTSDRNEVPESSDGVELPPADSAVREEEEKGGGESAVGTAAVVANTAEEDISKISERQAASLDPGPKPTPAGVGSHTFTMRELLDELKEKSQPEERSGADGNSKDSISSYGWAFSFQDNLQQQYVGQNDMAMDLINNVTGVDEEGRSRQRILAFAARRYAAAIERNPEDHDAFYNWALVLQESADNVSPDSSSPSKDALLEEACRKYDEATRLSIVVKEGAQTWARCRPALSGPKKAPKAG